MAEDPPPLVSTDWVERHHRHPEVVVAEVDEDTWAYRERGHVPGAVPLHWRDELRHRERLAPVAAADFAALMDRKGIRRDDHVVVYGGSNNWFAAYGYWVLRLHRHPRVSLMDGGRLAWEQEQRPLERGPGAREPTHGYPVPTSRPALHVDRDEVLARFVAAPEGTALVDVRTPAEFRGELTAPPHLPEESAQVAGHIPGAVNIPWEEAIDPDTGRFHDREHLARRYADAGATPDREIVTYCRIGERSAHTWFVLHELLGYPSVRNYDGSWAEYGSLVDVPIARGPG